MTDKTKAERLARRQMDALDEAFEMGLVDRAEYQREIDAIMLELNLAMQSPA